MVRGHSRYDADMARSRKRCKTCNSPHLDRINRLLLTGKSCREVARIMEREGFHITVAALSNHFKKHIYPEQVLSPKVIREAEIELGRDVEAAKEMQRIINQLWTRYKTRLAQEKELSEAGSTVLLQETEKVLSRLVKAVEAYNRITEGTKTHMDIATYLSNAREELGELVEREQRELEKIGRADLQ